MYFILKNNILLEERIWINESENTPLTGSFFDGEKITLPVDGPIIFTANAKAGDPMLDFLDANGVIVSKRFLELLQGAGVDNMQIFPAIVKSTIDDTVWEDYFVINILTMIACADFSESNYHVIGGGIFSFNELAIDVEKTKGALLFRLAEDPTTIIMHRNVGVYIKENDPDKTLRGWTIGKIIQ